MTRGNPSGAKTAKASESDSRQSEQRKNIVDVCPMSPTLTSNGLGFSRSALGSWATSGAFLLSRKAFQSLYFRPQHFERAVRLRWPQTVKPYWTGGQVGQLKA